MALGDLFYADPVTGEPIWLSPSKGDLLRGTGTAWERYAITAGQHGDVLTNDRAVSGLAIWQSPAASGASTAGYGLVYDAGPSGTLPTDWHQLGFDASAWSGAVAANSTIAAWSGTTGSWISYSNAVLAPDDDVWGYLAYFTVPAGVSTVALTFKADNYVDGIWVNGHDLGETGDWSTGSGTGGDPPATVTIPGTYLASGSTNLLAIQVRNESSPGATINPTGLVYSIDVGSGFATSLRTTSSTAAISDADLSQGSSTFGTDNTAALQGLLDLALSAPLCVIWDGSYSCTGLVVHSNTTILFLAGCGAILRSASNQPVFANEHAVWGTALAPTDTTIALLGPGIINGNGANQTWWASATGYVQAIRMWGVDNLRVEDLTIIDPCAFGVHVVNCSRVRGSRTRIIGFASGTVGNGQDGWHFNGPCDDIVLRDTTVTSWDDAIGINADDGSSPRAMGITGVAQGYGAITNVTVDGLYLDDHHYYGIRLLSCASAIDNVTIRRVRGATNAKWLVIGNYPGGTSSAAGSGAVGRVLLEDCQVAVGSSTRGTNDASGDIVLNGVIDRLTLRSIRRVGWIDAYPLIDIASGSVAQLTIEDLLLEDTDSANLATPAIHVGAPVGTLELRGVTLARGSLSAVNAAIVQTAADVALLRLIGINADRSTHLVDQVAGALTSVDAVGIRHSAAGGGATFALGGTTVAKLVLSNYDGALILSGTAPAATAGDAFATAPSGGTGGDLLVADGMSSPPVLLTDEAEDDVLVSG